MVATTNRLSGPPASIVAVRVKRRSRSAVDTAGHRPVSAEKELFRWLDEQEELEADRALEGVRRLWK